MTEREQEQAKALKSDVLDKGLVRSEWDRNFITKLAYYARVDWHYPLSDPQRKKLRGLLFDYSAELIAAGHGDLRFTEAPKPKRPA